MTQQELNLTTCNPTRGKELAAMLQASLTGGEWQHRKSMVALGWTSRDIRLARQHSDGAVIFGQRGFKLTRHAAPEEINECINTLESQAKVMLAEAQAVRRIAHRGIA
jgi:hypothetical protein